MILRTLLSHYRRHPMQALFLLSGIIIANVLLVGTQLINAQARASYARGEQILGAGPVGQILPRGDDNAIDERLFVDLRRAGFTSVAPLLRRFVRTADGQGLELLGLDALSMPTADATRQTDRVTEENESAAANAFGDFAFPPYAVLAAPARIKQLNSTAGKQLVLDSGARLPPLRAIDSGELGHRLLIDLGALQQLTESAGKITALMVFERDAVQLQTLIEALPPSVEYVTDDSAPDPAQLTRSLHLNLAAMGLLACVVGLFLTYNAVAFSYTDRRELLRKMRLAGVARGELATALVVELVVFLLLGGAIGLWLGSLLAASLLPGLGMTLAQLYDVYIAYPDTLLPSGYTVPLLTAAVAALGCACLPLRQVLHAPMLARWSEGWRLHTGLQRDQRLFLLGLALLTAAVLIGKNARDLWLALGGMACLLLGAALCLPAILRVALHQVSRRVPPQAVRLSWLMADSRWLLGPAALALMAMTLALVANSGLNTMIGSFRSATDAWLEQRLAAQLFVSDARFAKPEQLEALDSWLAARGDGAEFTARYRIPTDATTPSGQAINIEVVDLSPRQPFRSSITLIRAAEDAKTQFFAGDGVFVSERAWRLDGWQLGDRVRACAGTMPLPVLGIYHDYGNPLSQWMVSPERFRACWPDVAPSGIAIHGPAAIDWMQLRGDFVRDFMLRDSAVIDQGELRAVGLRVFDSTFAVTRALNLLTLIVAGIGIFCSVSAIHHHRVGQQALLASLGLSRIERGFLLLCQWGVLGVFCTVLVWPFGTGLAWYLAAVVTPVAFGWSFPLRIEWAPYFVLVGLATMALILAVMVPSLRLLRVSPAEMLREQSI